MVTQGAPPGEARRPGLAATWARVEEWGRSLRPAWRGLAAFLLYQALAFVIWIFPIVSQFTSRHAGSGRQDSRYYQWALEWTPWAIFHGVNPLHASHVFAPTGVDLAWSAFVPGPALATWPVTAVFGPMASLNLLMMLAPALAGWGAYLVCNRVTHRFWPSVIGGYFFGFSTYMAGMMIGFLNLVLIFPIPLLVYLVIRHVEGSLGSVAFVAGFTGLLVGLFSISTELFGTATLFGGGAFTGALAFGKGIRRQLVRTGVLVLLAGAIATIVLLPYLRDIVSNAPKEPLRGTAETSVGDLLSFVVPPPIIRLEGRTFADLSARLTRFPVLNGLGYVGFAVLAILVGFAITEWRRRSTWLLLGYVGFVSVLALGPVLYVDGRPHGHLPGEVLVHIPIIQSLLPSRFTAYSALATGVIAALWLAHAAGRWGWARWAIAALAVVSLLPHAANHGSPQRVPVFFTSDQVKRVLHHGEIVFVIPKFKGEEMMWQGAAGFWFNLAEGYIGPIPPELKSGPLARGLQLIKSKNRVKVPSPDEVATWMGEHHVSAIVLDDRARRKFRSLLQKIDFRSVYSGGGVSVWRRPAAA